MAKGKELQAIIDIAGSIDPSLSKSINKAVGQLDKIDWKAAAVGAAIGGIAIATGKAVLEASRYLADLGGQFDQAIDTIRIGTGATGEALEALNEDFTEVYKSVPTTMEDASKAIADYNTRLGLTGKPLQEIAKQAIQVSDMLDEDLGTVIENSSKAFQQWNVDVQEMGNAMDFVFKVSQSTGTGFSDLLDRVQKFGPQLQEMGYSLEAATVLIGQMDKAGVNADEVLAAMKKGVTALAKEGISASEGIAMYYEQIKNAGSAAEATALASEIFGSRAGSTMALAIRDGTLAIGDLTASLMESEESISKAAEDTYDFEQRLQMFRQNAEVALMPLANTVFDSLNKLMPPLSRAIETLAPTIGETVEVMAPLIEQLLDNLLPILEEMTPIILDLAKNILAKLLPPIMKIVEALLPAMMALLKALMPILDLAIDLLGPILDLVAKLLTPILDLITTAIAPLIETMSQLINTVLEPLGPIIDFLAGIFSETLGNAINGIMPIIDALMGYFSGLIDFIQSVFTGDWEGAWDAVVQIFQSIWDGIVAIFKFPINMIIDGINAFIGALNKIKIPDWVPGVGGMGIEIPLIPRLATGGFTDGVSIAGEEGVEAVISFDPRYRKQNISYWAQAGKMLGVADESELDALTEGCSNSVIYDLSGMQFAPQIYMENGDPEEMIRALKEYLPEFADLIIEAIRHKEEGIYA